jgi:uncharacterized protein (TIGR02757 family)
MQTMTANLPVSRPEKLKTVFGKLYEKYNRRSLIKPDPLQFVYEYSNPADMEIVGFLAASLAYGRVEQIANSLRNLFGRMGKSPFEFVGNFTNRDRAKLDDFKHRFNTGDDISDLLVLLQRALADYGSIEKFFLGFFDAADKNIILALTRFCDSLLDTHRSTHKGRISRGLAFLLASPGRGGAAKRLNLFLRWMVRSDDVDAGLWRSIDKSKLIVPVDVHMARLCKILGFHNHKNVSLKTAVEITKHFAEIEPADPVKYDFALSRIGILEDCTGLRRAECDACELLSWCLKRKDWHK